MMRLGAGVGARGAVWGGVSPLPSVLLPCARAGLCARGASPIDARGADAVTDRAALGGAVCVGWVPRVVRGDAGRAGLTATGGCRAAPPWLLYVAFGRAHVPVRWGGVRLAIACRHASIVVIVRAHETLQVRERVRGDGGGGVSGGDEASIAVIQDEVQVVLQRRSCARARVEQEGAVLGFARRLSLRHVLVIMVVLGEA